MTIAKRKAHSWWGLICSRVRAYEVFCSVLGLFLWMEYLIYLQGVCTNISDARGFSELLESSKRVFCTAEYHLSIADKIT